MGFDLKKDSDVIPFVASKALFIVLTNHQSDLPDEMNTSAARVAIEDEGIYQQVTTWRLTACWFGVVKKNSSFSAYSQ